MRPIRAWSRPRSRAIDAQRQQMARLRAEHAAKTETASEPVHCICTPERPCALHALRLNTENAGE